MLREETKGKLLVDNKKKDVLENNYSRPSEKIRSQKTKINDVIELEEK